MAQRLSKADEVLAALVSLGAGPHTAGEVVEATGFANSTVTDNLRKLATHLVVQRVVVGSKVHWQLNPATQAVTDAAARGQVNVLAEPSDADLLAEVDRLAALADQSEDELEKLRLRRTFLQDQAAANEPDPERAEDDPLPTRRQLKVSELAGDGMTTTGSPAAPTGARTKTAKGGTSTRGRLEGLIENWFRTQVEDGHEAGPYEVAKAVGAVTGSVHPALDRMVGKGVLVQSRTERPVRYRLA